MDAAFIFLMLLFVGVVSPRLSFVLLALVTAIGTDASRVGAFLQTLIGSTN